MPLLSPTHATPSSLSTPGWTECLTLAHPLLVLYDLHCSLGNVSYPPLSLPFILSSVLLSRFLIFPPVLGLSIRDEPPEMD